MRHEKLEDIAIIGLACRFPQANDYESFWQNLRAGKDCIQEVPKNRWDSEKHYSPDYNAPNKSITKWGGFLDQIDQFDQTFFQISPKEVEAMDPQQRLVLEEMWHCIEDAGLSLSELQNNSTAVYIGSMAMDYYEYMQTAQETTRFAASGNYKCMLANRASHIFGFTGESVSIDSACSSSLVALHEARESLLSESCDFAFAGGVSVICHPWKYISFSKARMLSPEGRCKTFDRDADGYVPGEGVGILLCRRLSDALRDNNRIYGVIKGSAVNHSGPSETLTAPRTESQTEVVRKALDSGNIKANTLSYIEAHGTGTSLGDPIEIEGLTHAFRKDTKERQYCPIGSVKTNIGHTEGAAGIAGVIKVLMMLKYREIAPTLNIKHLNPIIKFRRSPFFPSTELIPWKPHESKVLRAGVSSFGFGGVNAHAILEEAPKRKEVKAKEQAEIFTLSAKTEKSLKSALKNWHSYLDKTPSNLTELCAEAQRTRGDFRYRLGGFVRNKEELQQLITQSSPHIGDAKNFTGKVGAYLGDFSALNEKSIAALEKASPQFRHYRKECKEFPQFSVSYALTMTFKSLGIHETVVGGEGIGEWIALVVSGIIDLKTCLSILRGKVPQKLILARPKNYYYDTQTQALFEPYRIDESYFQALLGDYTLDEEGVDHYAQKAKELMVSQFTFIRTIEEWETALGLELKKWLKGQWPKDKRQRFLLGIVVLFSLKRLNLKWQLREDRALMSEGVSELVDLLLDGALRMQDIKPLLANAKPQFSEAVKRLREKEESISWKKPYQILKEKNQLLNEVSNPKSWLKEVGKSQGKPKAFSKAVQRLSLDTVTWLGIQGEGPMILGQDLESEYKQTLFQLWLKGAPIDWSSYQEQLLFSEVPLPSYPYSRESYWVHKTEKEKVQALHPLLHSNSSTFSKEQFTSTFTGQEHFLNDHQVRGAKVLPAVAYLEMMREAVLQARGSLDKRAVVLKNVVWEQAIEVQEQPVTVHLELIPKEEQIGIEIYTNSEVIHSKGVAEFIADEALSQINPKEVQKRCAKKVFSKEEIYSTFSAMGLAYGPSHQGIEEISLGKDELLAKLQLPETVADTLNDYCLHPSIMDSALQAAYGFIMHSQEKKLFIPFALDECIVRTACTEQMWVVVQQKKQHKFDLILCDNKGNICFELKGFLVRLLEGKIAHPKKEPSKAQLYQPVWKEEEIIADQITEEVKTALLIGEQDDSTLKSLNDKLKQQSIDPISIFSGEEFEEESPSRYFSNFSSYESIELTLKALKEKFRSKESIGLFYLYGKEDCIETLIGFLRACTRNGIQTKLNLTILVPDAFAVVEQDQCIGYLKAGLVGLAKAFKQETPKVQIHCIDISKEQEKKAEILIRESKSNAQVIAYRQGKRYVKEYTLVPQPKKSLSLFEKDGVYLITGGMGGIGQQIVEAVSKDLTCTFILTGRSSLDSEKETLLQKLNHGKAEIVYIQADVCSQDEVASLLKEIKSRFGSLTGIIHAAGIIEDKLIANKTLAAVKRVLAPKLQGAELLDSLTADEPLAFFLVFSSVVSEIGNIGQSDYAAANAILDAWSAHRQRKRQGKSISLNWTLWEGKGMGNSVAKAQLARIGIHPLPSATAVQLLQQVLSHDATQLIVLHKGNNPFIKEKPLPSSAKEEQSTILDKLCKVFADVLSVSAEDIDLKADMAEFGVDSVAIMQIIDQLSDQFKTPLHPSLLMDYPTIEQLADHLGEKVKLPKPPKEKTVPVPVEAVAPTSQAIAVIGMAGRFPKAPTLEEFWDNLKSGKDAITEIPASRMDSREFSKRGIYSHWGGFIGDVGLFDAEYFHLSDERAIEMDPQQRLFLELTQELIDHSGYQKEELAGQMVGLYIGAHESNYGRKIEDRPKYKGKEGVVNVISNLIAGRVMDFYDLHGPAEVMYTACSSSLVSTHQACQALRNGECTLAIAGGIELLLDDEWFQGFCASNVLAKDGKCKVFDEHADGFVLGEGMGAVLLKPLEPALEDGDSIYGVIRGSAVNNDGSSMGLTTPNIEGQKAVIKKALENAKTKPSEISYYEAHGTGTQLGDPIEIKAAMEVYREETEKTGYCAVGSVKSNIGHTLGAAGVASLIKVLLCMNHQKLVPTLHCHKPHPRFNFEQSPFYPNFETKPWEVTGKRIAGISSFGFGGTNCHIIVEEGHNPKRKPLPRTSFHRKRYWINEPILSENESFLREVMKAVEQGRMSPEAAKAYLKESQ